MYELLAIAIVLLFLALKYRETFVVKYGNPMDGQDLISFDPDAKGNRIFGITPDTCPATKPELDAGLCYEACQQGYHGVGPMCWADTFGVGVGIPVSYPRCSDLGYNMNDYWDGGLTCNRNIYWDTCAWRSIFGCVGGLKGGEMEPKREPCFGNPEHKDYVDGLCYKKCPSNMPNRVPGMPTFCYVGNRGLSYGRGGGEAPPLVAFGN